MRIAFHPAFSRAHVRFWRTLGGMVVDFAPSLAALIAYGALPLSYAPVMAALPLVVRRDRGALLVLVVCAVLAPAVLGSGARFDGWGVEFAWLTPWLVAALLMLRRRPASIAERLRLALVCASMAFVAIKDAGTIHVVAFFVLFALPDITRIGPRRGQALAPQLSLRWSLAVPAILAALAQTALLGWNKGALLAELFRPHCSDGPFTFLVCSSLVSASWIATAGAAAALAIWTVRASGISLRVVVGLALISAASLSLALHPTWRALADFGGALPVPVQLLYDTGVFLAHRGGVGWLVAGSTLPFVVLAIALRSWHAAIPLALLGVRWIAFHPDSALRMTLSLLSLIAAIIAIDLIARRASCRSASSPAASPPTLRAFVSSLGRPLRGAGSSGGTSA